MQKTVVRNPNQSAIRRNLLNIAGIAVQGETIAPQNGDRLLGGYGVAWLNNQDAASQTTGQDNPLPECNCESGGGGGGSGGGGGVQPSGNCEKKNISELKQVLDDYAAQSFCDKEFPEVQFSTFIGYDKPPSDSTAKEIELRMLCPSDECEFNKYDDKIRYEWIIRAQHVGYGGISCYSCGESAGECFNGGMPETPYDDEFVDTLKGAMQRFFSINPSSLLYEYIENVISYRIRDGYCSSMFPNDDITIEDKGISNVMSDSQGKISVIDSNAMCYGFNGHALDRFGYDILTRIDFFLFVGSIVQ